MLIEKRRVGVMVMVAAFVSSAAPAVAQRQSGIQRTPDGARVLVSKDVGGQRYAITLNVADGTVTGNIFSTVGSAPQFISCAPEGESEFNCRVAATCDPSAGRESGIQRAFDSSAVLVSKDVSGQRYAITRNVDGTLTGNVFFSETGAAKFLFCNSDDVGGYACAIADSCTTQPCASQFTPLSGSVTLPDTFFTLPDSCVTYGDPIAITLPKYFFVPDTELLGEASRLAVVHNPFRTQTGRGGMVNDLILAARDFVGPVKVGDTATCPAGGLQRLARCEQQGTFAVSSITFENCTSGSNDTGFVVQNGTVEISRDDSTLCLLFTQPDIPLGVELFERRTDFETEFFNGPGVRLETDTENNGMVTTHPLLCLDRKQRIVSASRRGIIGRREADIDRTPGTGDVVFVSQDFSSVDLGRDSAVCSLDTTISTGDPGAVSTIDGLFGESYSTSFASLRYGFVSGEDGATTVTIDGSLTDICELDPSLRSTFAYRTLTPASFDRDGDGCPRGGAFEVTADGSVVGQVAFTDTGGVTLTPTGGTSTTLASCNDLALLLTSCRTNM